MTGEKKPRMVREPLQVYLTSADRALLDRAAAAAGVPRAEILRQGLHLVAAGVDPNAHPALAMVREMTAGWPEDMPRDVARKHDAYLAGASSAAAPLRRPATRASSTPSKPRAAGKRRKRS